ncbi:MAG: hypothetical protein WD824_17545 [Cyclobacteriaceae bacterium]
MKPLILFLCSMPFFIPPAFQEVSHSIATATHAVLSAPPLILVLVEPPPPSQVLEVITTVLILASIVLSLISLWVIFRYGKKEAEDSELPAQAAAQDKKHPHTTAIMLLFITIVLVVLSIISFMFTEPGMKPHPLAEPDRPAPILIADPHTTESLFLLAGIILACASMFSLLNNKNKPHKHGLSIFLSFVCFILVLLGGLHYWFTFSI